MDKGAPLRSKTVTVQSDVACYDDDIHEARGERRTLEQKWRQSKLEIDHQVYCTQRQKVSRRVRSAEKAHYSSQAQSSANESRHLFKTVRMPLHQSGYAPLPAADSLEELISRFEGFFTEKVSQIHNSVAHTDEVMVHPEQPVTLLHGCSLDSFRLTT